MDIIKDPKTGKALSEPRGFCVDTVATGDVARFRELLRMTLWLGGTKYAKVGTKNRCIGVPTILCRCLVDVSMRSPKRLDFVGGAVVTTHAPSSTLALRQQEGR